MFVNLKMNCSGFVSYGALDGESRHTRPHTFLAGVRDRS